MKQDIHSSIDYGIYTDDSMAYLISGGAVIFECAVTGKDGLAEAAERCFSEIRARLLYPFRILIFGPTPLKYALYTFLDQSTPARGYPAMAYTVKEVFITELLQPAGMVSFTEKHFAIRISL